MAILEEGSPDMVALESLVDKAGLRNVVFALAHICNAKADHTRTNWQDHALAAQWQRKAAKLDRTAESLAMEW